MQSKRELHTLRFILLLYLDLAEGAWAEVTWKGYVAIEGEVKSELTLTGAGLVALWTCPQLAQLLVSLCVVLVEILDVDLE